MLRHGEEFVKTTGSESVVVFLLSTELQRLVTQSVLHICFPMTEGAGGQRGNVPPLPCSYTCQPRYDAFSKTREHLKGSEGLPAHSHWQYTMTTSVCVREHGLEGARKHVRAWMSYISVWEKGSVLGENYVLRNVLFVLKVWLMLVTDLHELPQAHGEKLTSMAWLYCSSRLSILVIGTGGWAFFRLLLFLRK